MFDLVGCLRWFFYFWVLWSWSFVYFGVVGGVVGVCVGVGGVDDVEF